MCCRSLQIDPVFSHSTHPPAITSAKTLYPQNRLMHSLQAPAVHDRRIHWDRVVVGRRWTVHSLAAVLRCKVLDTLAKRSIVSAPRTPDLSTCCDCLILATSHLKGASMRRMAEFWRAHVAAIKREGISTVGMQSSMRLRQKACIVGSAN